MAMGRRRVDRTVRVWAAFAAALCCCAAAGRQAAPGEPAKAGAGGPKIGVVNVSRVFQAYVRVKEISEQMQKIYGEKEKALLERKRRLKDWEGKLKLDTRGKDDPEFFEELQKFERERFLMERDYKRLADEVDEQKAAEMRKVLNDIRNAISAVAAAMELDIVLTAMEFDDADAEQPRTAEGLVRQFRGNSVLYHAPALDITKNVIDALNIGYRKKEGSMRGGSIEEGGRKEGAVRPVADAAPEAG